MGLESVLLGLLALIMLVNAYCIDSHAKRIKALEDRELEAIKLLVRDGRRDI